jgi:hypothetical protein
MSPILGARGGLSVKAYGFTSAAASLTAYESIATSTVGSGGVASVTFSSISGSYTHLQLRCLARGTYNLNASSSLNVQLNGNSTIGNYSTHLIDGNGSSASAYGASADYPQGATSNATAGASIFGVAIIDILDYTNTNKYKTVKILSGNDNNGSGTVRFSSGSFFANTNAITSITLTSGGGNIAEFSTFALYGIKGA